MKFSHVVTDSVFYKDRDGRGGIFLAVKDTRNYLATPQ